MIGYRLLAAALAVILLTAARDPPAELRRGVNITHWFRFPPSRDPMALRGYLDDAALEALKRTGFTFLRIPVQPDLLAHPEVLSAAVQRVQRQGLAVVVALFAAEWHLETSAGDRARLLATWHSLAPQLRPFDPKLTFPEVLNEPVFAEEPGAWAALQHEAVVAIRRSLPDNTIVLTGTNWGSIDGLLKLPPEADPNVVYSFHVYEPAELTALGAYRPGLDSTAMARLPFPVQDVVRCSGMARHTTDAATAGLIRFYCAQRWDAEKITGRIAEAAEWARQNHVRVFAGEFGASERLNAPARLAWLAAVHEACEREAMGWALWGYDDSMGLGVRPGDRPRFDPALVRALGLDRAE
jgi:aryl-phospho-beta-D-glucosidase BglC (GH1 family)